MTDARVEAFTESISFDRRLYRQDLRGSMAHAKMLAHVQLLTQEEAASIVTALETIGREIEAGHFTYSTALEDIHTHIEKALIERLGDTGRKLHTGRSRNDQVVTAVKLWVRDAIDELGIALTDLQRTWVEMAQREQEVILPGYTHLQRAQPVLAAHYCLAYVEKFQRDRDRLADTRKRLNELPLGAAALAGTSLPIDREFVCRELAFDRVAANSLDISSDRDFLLEFVFDLTTIALHLAGWAEEWILWSTVEFGFIDLPDSFCTGSSIMPHKKNPDVLELTRGKSASVVGCLQQLLVLVKGLPLAYNRDLQEDKPAAFAAYDTVLAMVLIAAPLIAQTRFRRETIAARLEEGFLDATTFMEHLVTQGMPLRTAHEAVGKLVRLCEERRCKLIDLPPDTFDAIQPALSKTVYSRLGVANALQAFRSYGSTAPKEVAEQVRRWQDRLRD